jgi:hypothetical protein
VFSLFRGSNADKITKSGTHLLIISIAFLRRVENRFVAGARLRIVHRRSGGCCYLDLGTTFLHFRKFSSGMWLRRSKVRFRRPTLSSAATTSAAPLPPHRVRSKMIPSLEWVVRATPFSGDPCPVFEGPASPCRRVIAVVSAAMLLAWVCRKRFHSPLSSSLKSKIRLEKKPGQIKVCA